MSIRTVHTWNEIKHITVAVALYNNQCSYYERLITRQLFYRAVHGGNLRDNRIVEQHARNDEPAEFLDEIREQQTKAIPLSNARRRNF